MATIVAPAASPSAPSAPHERETVQQGPAWWWAAYLAAIIVAELVTSIGSPELGVVLHLALILTIPIHAMFVAPPAQGFLIALVLAPLIRIVSLAMPLAGLSPVTQHLLTSAPIAVGALAAMRVIGLAPREVGLRLGRLPLQLGIGLLGLPLGVLVYGILQPAPIVPDLGWRSALFPLLVFLVSIGLLEELVFRGILQTLGQRTLGAWGIGFVSAVFAALQIGYLSPPHTGMVFMVGLLFAWLAARTHSIVGVALAHGLTNVVVYMLFPLLAVQGGWALPDVAWSGYARSGGPDSPAVTVQTDTSAPGQIAVGPTPVSRQATASTPTAPTPIALTPTPVAQSPAVVASPTTPASASPEPTTLAPAPAAAGLVPPEQATTEQVTVTADGEANVRAAPSIEADVLAIIPSGQTLEIAGENRTVEERTWRNVRLPDGRIGWIDETLTEPVTEPVTEHAPAAPESGPPPAPAASPVPAGQPPANPPDDPVRTVTQFYDALGQADYDLLVSLWSDRLRDLINLDADQLRAHPPSQDLQLERAELVSLDEARGEATVNIEALETLEPAQGLTRRYVGTWRLVRGPAGWLLDEPRIQIQQ